MWQRAPCHRGNSSLTISQRLLCTAHMVQRGLAAWRIWPQICHIAHGESMHPSVPIVGALVLPSGVFYTHLPPLHFRFVHTASAGVTAARVDVSKTAQVTAAHKHVLQSHLPIAVQIVNSSSWGDVSGYAPGHALSHCRKSLQSSAPISAHPRGGCSP